MQRWFGLGLLPDGRGVLVLLVVLFVAVAAAAWPVVRGLTRRLEALKAGVDAFGAGALTQRVPEEGRDEVAALATSFNRAAGRIETLVRSHQSLLANASHELRSPLARLKMAVSMLDDSDGLGAGAQAAAPAADRETAAAGRNPDPEAKLRASLRKEIHTNIAELDALVEEVLLASRLDAAAIEGSPATPQPVDLLALAAEEAAALGVQLTVEAQVQAQVQPKTQAQNNSLIVAGDERLLRRAVRNLLENARRYGGQDVELRLSQRAGQAELQVCDRGPGVPEAYRERIFEAFFRLPGHAEREGGVGLGLALVRQIAQRHAGQVRCEPRSGGGSCFVLVLPLLGFESRSAPRFASPVVAASSKTPQVPGPPGPPGPPATPLV
jgi:signal transduction histidine kinase